MSRTGACAPPTATETGGAEQTAALGAALAAGLAPGDVVLLTGEMGTGKTTFVRGACRALGVEGPVTSPTYVLGRRYAGRDVEVSHLDLHRLASLEGEDPALLYDHVGPGRVAFVEWPEAGGAELRAAAHVVAHVRLEHRGGDRRLVEIRREPPVRP